MVAELKFDVGEIDRKLGNALKAAGSKVPLIIVRALNHTGPIARTAMIRSMVKQTGMTRRVMAKALRQKLAFNGGNYEIKSRGGDVRLMFFKPRETRRGTSAAPWNKRRLYAGAFLKGGSFGKRNAKGQGGKTSSGRVPLKMGGAVLQRVGKSRLPLKGLKSGLYIPEEMTKGNTEAVFYATVNARLPDRLAHELYRILGG